jgi:hypothetical protein
MSSNKNSFKSCECGNRIELNKVVSVCPVCSTCYNKSGIMLSSRHNWNVKDYFCLFLKNESNLIEKHRS